MNLELPLVFAAWGFREGAAAWNHSYNLARLCVDNGIRTVAVQQGRDEKGRWATEPNDVAELRALGLRVALWGVAHHWDARSELSRLGIPEADWLPQIEGPGQRDLVLEAADAGLKSPTIVTNYSGAGSESSLDVSALRGAGVRAVLVECYNDAGPILPFTDLDRMLWQGTAYGWRPDELVATMGTYHGELPNVYKGVDDVGRDFGLYLAEPMSLDQWEAYGELYPVIPPEPEPPTPEPEDDMEPVTDTQGRQAVEFAVQAAAQNWKGDPKPRARLTVCRRIAQAGNDDPKWNAARDAVVKALDSAGVPE